MRVKRGSIGWQPVVIVATVAAAAIGVKATFEKPSSSETRHQQVRADGVHESASDVKRETKKGENAMSSSSNPQVAGGSVIHAAEKDFEEKVLDAEGRVLVDFYADWCGPCRMLAPVLEELARDAPEARIVKVDVDQNAKLAAQYRIQSIPAIIVFENGRP
ncbi:MAG: thioredoxin, partial [Planctomycetota bacterium]